MRRALYDKSCEVCFIGVFMFPPVNKKKKLSNVWSRDKLVLLYQRVLLSRALVDKHGTVLEVAAQVKFERRA